MFRATIKVTSASSDKETTLFFTFDSEPSLEDVIKKYNNMVIAKWKIDMKKRFVEIIDVNPDWTEKDEENYKRQILAENIRREDSRYTLIN